MSEERAGLDARGSARERLLNRLEARAASLAEQEHGHPDSHRGDVTDVRRELPRIEAEAVTAERGRLIAAIQALMTDEERAGLDARGRLLRLYDEPTLINAVEAEAVAAERVRLAEAFREWVAIVNYDRPRFTQDVADKFLALLEDTSTPSKAEPSGGME